MVDAACFLVGITSDYVAAHTSSYGLVFRRHDRGMRKNVAPYVGCVDVTQDTTGRFYESEAAHEESSIVQNHDSLAGAWGAGEGRSTHSGRTERVIGNMKRRWAEDEVPDGLRRFATTLDKKCHGWENDSKWSSSLEATMGNPIQMHTRLIPRRICQQCRHGGYNSA
ncbi:hypothetical protein BKA83DRAFT_4132504 [Pisolithus microcarpus]|nr:hypothetical protein BKA83DRAFT_4132504 [Pisolithus microcarpus]